jgi:hypothetical protein
VGCGGRPIRRWGGLVGRGILRQHQANVRRANFNHVRRVAIQHRLMGDQVAVLKGAVGAGVLDQPAPAVQLCVVEHPRVAARDHVVVDDNIVRPVAPDADLASGAQGYRLHLTGGHGHQQIGAARHDADPLEHTDQAAGLVARPDAHRQHGDEDTDQ